MLIYLTSIGNNYRINFTKFLGQEDFYNVNRNIKKCPSAQLISTDKEKFWIIDYNDINVLKKYYPDMVVVEEDTNTCLSVVPQQFEKDIPHLNEMKLKLFDYQVVGVSYLSANNRAILADEMGCVSGDSKVKIKEVGKPTTRNIKIKYLKDLFETNKTIKIKCMVNNRFAYLPIKAVLDKGVRKTIRIDLEDTHLICTPDHLIYTRDGWKEAGKITTDDEVFTNGKQVCPLCGSDSDLITYKYSKFFGYCRKCMYSQRDGKVFKGNKLYKRLDKDGYVRLFGKPTRTMPNYDKVCGGIYEHHQVWYENTGHIVDTKVEVVHHINGIKTDNRFENLQLMSKSEHSDMHLDMKTKHLYQFNEDLDYVIRKGTRIQLVPRLQKVTSIQQDEEQKVYDIAIDDKEIHNFICNNIIIHNCGKTPQYLSTIYVLFREKKIKHALIVCPNAIKYQIKSEVSNFFHDEEYGFTCELVDGTVKKRMKQYESWDKERPVITIVNYELLNNDIDIFKNLHFDIMICDEAHRLKNAGTITYKTIKLLSSQINIFHLVTGTVFSKEPLNIFNMFALLNKNILGPYNKFAREYLIVGEKYGRKNCILEVKSYPKFHAVIAPYILRRLKSEVAESLPKLTITNRYVEMTPEQKRIDRILQEDLEEFSKRVKSSTKYDEDDNIIWQDPRADALQGYLVLRHCVADSIDLLKMGTKKMTAKYAAMVKYPKKYTPSPKIKETIEICDEAISSNKKQKIVIFTQYERMQRLLYAELSKKYKTICVNGLMSAKEKNANIVAFQTTDINILIGTNSINYGINLQQSNLCICVDQSWLPDVEDQRHGRIHRINTMFDKVSVINLVSLESIDEKIIETLDARREMANKLIEKSEIESDLLSQVTSLLINRVKIK